jgi:hypothetical protein
LVKLFFNKGPAAGPQVPAAAAPIPEGAQQITKVIDTWMPFIESTTGLTRKEIFLQLMKTGVRGGNILSFLEGFSGRPQEKEVRFVRIVKTLAIWLPVAIFLVGLSLVTIVLYAKFIINLMGT